MKQLVKRSVAHLPRRWQQEMKRVHFGRAFARGRYSAGEPEWERLHEWVKAGDWVVDVGANVGHYTAKLSQLVGAHGRVLAFEPVPETFELLSANLARLPNRNVTLFNAALSDSTALVGMSIPKFDTGLDNFYMAQINGEKSGSAAALSVLTLPMDALDLPHPVRLVKIDAAGHERSVLSGMIRLLRRDHPVLIVEDNDSSLTEFLAAEGYRRTHAEGSCNCVFLPTS